MSTDETPISNKLWRSFDSTVQSTDEIFDRMRDLERAANALREAIMRLMADMRDFGDVTEQSGERVITSVRAFDALKEKTRHL